MKYFSHILAIRFMQQEFEGFADYFLATPWTTRTF